MEEIETLLSELDEDEKSNLIMETLKLMLIKEFN